MSKKTKKKNTLLTTIDSGSYPFDVVLGFAVKKDDILSYIMKQYDFELDEQGKKSLEPSGNTDARVIQIDGGQFIFWMKEYPKCHRHYTLIVHETAHITQLLFQAIGMPHTEDVYEAFAYQQGYYFEKIIGLLSDKCFCGNKLK